MSLKENFENHPLVFLSTLILSAFGTGIGAEKYLHEPPSVSEGRTVDWTRAARENGWGPLNECPAYPVSIKITSPGDGSSISIYSNAVDSSIKYVIVAQISRPLPSTSDVGFIINERGSKNFYINFPSYCLNDKRTICTKKYAHLAFIPKKSSYVSVWTAVVSEKEKYGEVYSSLDQIRAVDTEAVISEPVSLGINPER